MPSRISFAWSIVGSSTITGWKRRSRAASFSMYLRYSSRVVAPMHCSSPRDNGGLRMFAASIAPSAAPAPTECGLVDEQDRVAARPELLDDLLQPLLELAAVLRPGHQRTDVRGEHALLLKERVRHVTGHDPMGQRFGDRGLAHAARR